ncbi:hypothetical protein ABIA16_001723 [Sinorhizobium fredii]
MMPRPVTAVRLDRAFTTAIPTAVLRSHDLTVKERSALLDCYATPDRTFVEIGAAHGVDRERLQDLWFDLFVRPSHS